MNASITTEGPEFLVNIHEFLSDMCHHNFIESILAAPCINTTKFRHIVSGLFQTWAQLGEMGAQASTCKATTP